MGDRGNVIIRYQWAGAAGAPKDVYLYTHWYGSALEGILADALDSEAGRNRWSDEAYLARIIFSRMLWVADEHDREYAKKHPEVGAWLGSDGLLGEVGFGIAPYPPDSDGHDYLVDTAAMTVNGVGYEDFIRAVKGSPFEVDIEKAEG